MRNSFELFVARRYLMAKRKQAVISLITVISVAGVAAGVMALVIALAINNGFRNTLQRNLVGATAHVTILEKEPGYGIRDWREVIARVRRAPHVVSAAPTLYGSVFLAGPVQSSGAVLKGVSFAPGAPLPGFISRLKEGSAAALDDAHGPPGILLGSRLAQSTGLVLNARVNVISPQGELTPLGPRPSYHWFRVAGIFESGFYDLDSGWAFTGMAASQRVLALDDVVNAIELRLDDIYAAPEVARSVEAMLGPKLAATHWMEQNKQLLGALQMERAVTVVTIGLIQFVAALNILISLVMMVMEKHRDIAILMSMGARREQIRNIFMLQGVLIGVTGSAIGLAVGHTLNYFADRYHWVRLSEEVYTIGFVPFEPRWIDSLWIAGAAILVSFLATLHPARAATRVAPVEALRYE
ncbi:MAG: ABC transporter permease [Acidobacteria bacterium]|nr:ABC transporter permease [Acidobacteriota bacterium]